MLKLPRLAKHGGQDDQRSYVGGCVQEDVDCCAQAKYRGRRERLIYSDVRMKSHSHSICAHPVIHLVAGFCYTMPIGSDPQSEGYNRTNRIPCAIGQSEFTTDGCAEATGSYTTVLFTATGS